MTSDTATGRLGVAVLTLVLVFAGCLGTVPAVETDAEPTTPTATATEGRMTVHFIPVGQSVSTLVIAPSGETMLIDTGHFTDDGRYVLAYLERLGIERIDHLVVTHNDADHIGGNAAIIDHFETEKDGIGAVYDPGIPASTQTYEEYLDAVERHDVQLFEIREGDRLPFEGVDVRVLGPPEPYIEDGARNENSVVLKLAFGRTSFLFTGDAEDDQEAYLVERYGSTLNATVLKAGHHGSDSSTSDTLLDAVDPKAVVISSAYDSQYGHPDEATLDRLAARSIPTYWTAAHGAIVLVSDGTGVTVRTQAAAPTDPDRLREADPVPLGSDAPVERRARYGGAPATATADSASPTDTTPAQTATAVTDGGTAPPAALEVVEIEADAAGDDRDNLNGEYVVFRNTGDAPLDLSGRTVSDEAGATYTFPDVTLAPGERITLHTGSGTDTDSDLYWDRGRPVWNNGGDTVTVRTANGTVVTEATYS